MNTGITISIGVVLIVLISLSIYLIVVTNTLKKDVKDNKTDTATQSNQLSSLKSSFTSMNTQLQKINSVFSSDMKTLNGIETLNMTNGWGITSAYPKQLQFFGIGPKTKVPKVVGLFKSGPDETPGTFFTGPAGVVPSITQDQPGVCIPGGFC